MRRLAPLPQTLVRASLVKDDRLNILSLKPGHDGAVSYVMDGRLIFSVEPEKDSAPRHSAISAETLALALELAPEVPDVIALGGWHKTNPEEYTGVGAGYFGVSPPTIREASVLGRPTVMFTSSHERSHIYMAVGMACVEPIEECVVLVWEGVIGSIYHWQQFGRTIRKIDVLRHPGARYVALFEIADPEFPESGCDVRDENAGKLMALAAYGAAAKASPEDVRTIEQLLALDEMYPFQKGYFARSGLYNVGTTSERVAHAARLLTDRIFRLFREALVDAGLGGLPLVISGGCGLNCDWNEAWRSSGVVSSVFVPPCTNDSGSSIGTAIDAMQSLTGQATGLKWSVYSGPYWIDDGGISPVRPGWRKRTCDLAVIADELARGRVFAWVRGRAEIGPRALGHRSLIASPLTAGMRDELNRIKSREGYRPVAPAVLLDHADPWVEWTSADPYMLYLARVKCDGIPAVTHVDRSARPQFVRMGDESGLFAVLDAFEQRTGVPVLCNTSLNYPGRGFLNRTSEILRYCEKLGILNAVFDDVWLEYTLEGTVPQMSS